MSTPNEWLHRKQISDLDIKSCKHRGGRVPWYSPSTKSRKHKQTFLIGVGGGTASGKTSVCKAIVNQLQLPWVQILSLDCFYRALTPSEHINVSNYNFDHPNAFDWDLLLQVLKELKQGKAVQCPQYDFTTHSRKEEYTLMYGADVVLCEGILILHNPQILNQFDVKVFVKTDDDIRLIRRIKRDIAERGRQLDGVLEQYQKTVKPSYMLFCEPTQVHADIVIPRGRDNIVAIQLLCDHIKNKLIEGGNIAPMFYKSKSNAMEEYKSNSNVILPNNVIVLKINDEITGDKNEVTSIDMLFDNTLNGKLLLQCISIYCNELITSCINQFIPRRFVTPSPIVTNASSPQFESKRPTDMILNESNESPEIICLDSNSNNSSSEEESKCDSKCGNKLSVCVVTIFSGGMLFGESILDSMDKNELLKVSFGSIHIFHESRKPAKPRFYDRKLPKDIHKQKVIMVDAFIGTGNRARMALQVIIDHHVPEENICFITLMSSYEGIINLAKVFPNVQFITGKIDSNGKDKHWETIPITSDLVIKYCQAAGIDIVEDKSESSFK